MKERELAKSPEALPAFNASEGTGLSLFFLKSGYSVARWPTTYTGHPRLWRCRVELPATVKNFKVEFGDNESTGAYTSPCKTEGTGIMFPSSVLLLMMVMWRRPTCSLRARWLERAGKIQNLLTCTVLQVLSTFWLLKLMHPIKQTRTRKWLWAAPRLLSRS